jgi:maleylacetoacetate isomerase
MAGLELYSYWRSSAAYRVRIALNLKGLPHEIVAVNIAPGKDEQKSPAHRALNPQGRVPAIRLAGASPSTLNQSPAIIEWLEDAYPTPALLPADPWARAQVRAFAATIACDVHPLNNLGPLGWLRTRHGASEADVTAWLQHWMALGFAALEENLVRTASGSGPWLFGDGPGLAEFYLVPQVYNARRFGLDLGPYPRLVAADAAARALPPFADAAPEAQADAPATPR